MHIVALIATEAVSGPGRQLAALAAALPRHGARITVLVFHRRGRPAPPFAAFLERAGVDHEVVPDRGPLDLEMVRDVRSRLHRLGPDLVQSHGYKATALARALRATGGGWPWVGCFHGATHEDRKARLYHRLDRWMLRAADRVVVMSAEQARLFHPRLRVGVVHNAILPSPATPAPEPAWLGTLRSDTPRPRLGVVGRLSHEKGVDTFLRALALLHERGVRAAGVVAGDGGERHALERLADDLAVRDGVRFLGTVAEVEALYPELDLLVIPSRSEGLPNVLLEAVRAGTPVVATRVGAVPEVITSAAAGTLVEPDAPEALAAAIEAALRHRRGAEEEAARRALLLRFSLEARVRAHLDLYGQLLGSRQEAVTARRGDAKGVVCAG